MSLVWKLLRQHISIPQFVGFFFANLVGMAIILLGIQFYTDTQAIYSSEDSFMRNDYLIINKQIGAVTAITGRDNSFSEAEVQDLESQSFVEKAGVFTSSQFDVSASFDAGEFSKFSTEMFFESVPDAFLDVSSEAWHYTESSHEIPIILPKNYLDLYNFGFAQSRNMPKLSEGILGAVKLQIRIRTQQHDDSYEGKIVGFSSRLNTILVPQAFMDWANPYYAGKTSDAPTRIILQVNNPADEHLTTYLRDNNYVTDEAKLDASKTTFVLRVIVAIVMSVGLVISILAFYILMLSIWLLVQKNTVKLQNLLLIGYSPSRVSLPYQLLTVGLNLFVFCLAFLLLLAVRSIYMNLFESFFPDMSAPSVWLSLGVGTALLVLVSVLNIIAVKRKVISIWNRKN